MFNFKKNDDGKIKKTAEEFLRKISPDSEVSVSRAENDTTVIEVKASDAQTLIGQNGETLLAMQHLLRVILKKSGIEAGRIDLDINDYKKKRKEYLKEMAVAAANDAALSKKEKELPPMNAYERRIVHMELVNRADITAESRGVEPGRRIVIKPA